MSYEDWDIQQIMHLLRLGFSPNNAFTKTVIFTMDAHVILRLGYAPNNAFTKTNKPNNAFT